MTTTHPTSTGVRLGLAVAGLGLTGALLTACGGSDDTSNSASPTQSTTTAQTTTTSSTSQSSTTASESSPQLPTDAIGAPQTVSGKGFTAKISVSQNISIRPADASSGANVVVPISIDVTQGSINPEPSNWRIVTLNGQTIQGGTSGAAIPNIMGSNPVDGHAEGVLTFPDYSRVLSAGTQIAEVDLTDPADTSFNKNPLARWKLTTPAPVSSLPIAPTTS